MPLVLVLSLLITAAAVAAQQAKAIHSFGGADGSSPQPGGVIFDALGNLYGTTMAGGANEVSTGVSHEFYFFLLLIADRSYRCCLAHSIHFM